MRSKSDRLVKCQLGALIFLIYECVTGEHRTGEDRSFMMQGKQDGNPVGLDWSDRPHFPTSLTSLSLLGHARSQRGTGGTTSTLDIRSNQIVMPCRPYIPDYTKRDAGAGAGSWELGAWIPGVWPAATSSPATILLQSQSLHQLNFCISYHHHPPLYTTQPRARVMSYYPPR